MTWCLTTKYSNHEAYVICCVVFFCCFHRGFRAWKQYSDVDDSPGPAIFNAWKWRVVEPVAQPIFFCDLETWNKYPLYRDMMKKRSGNISRGKQNTHTHTHAVSPLYLGGAERDAKITSNKKPRLKAPSTPCQLLIFCCRLTEIPQKTCPNVSQNTSILKVFFCFEGA